MGSSRILIVEDDAWIRELLERILEPLCGQLITTDTLQAGSDAACRGSFDLAILDHYLPDGRSLGLGRTLIEHRGTPVIFMSGMHEARPRVEALNMGAVDWLGKPFFSEELLVRVRRALSRTVSPQTGVERRYRFAGWAFLSSRRQLQTPDGAVLRLSAGLTRLLLLFLEADGLDVSREMIALAIPDRPWNPSDSRVDRAVDMLRKIFSQYDGRTPGLRPKIIRSARGALQLNVPVVRVDRVVGSP